MSFNELLGIIKEAKEIRQEDKTKPLVDCPVCGTLLEKNGRGQVNCPLGHYRAESDVRPNGYN